MGKKIKLPLENGLAALCNHIRAIKQTAEQSGSAVSALAQATAASIEEIEGILCEKQDASGAVSFTIPAKGWTQDETVQEFPFRYELAFTGITAKDRADINIAPAGQDAAYSCGLCRTSETQDGKIIIRAVTAPTEAIPAELWLHQGKE